LQSLAFPDVLNILFSPPLFFFSIVFFLFFFSWHFRFSFRFPLFVRFLVVPACCTPPVSVLFLTDPQPFFFHVLCHFCLILFFPLANTSLRRPSGAPPNGGFCKHFFAPFSQFFFPPTSLLFFVVYLFFSLFFFFKIRFACSQVPFFLFCERKVPPLFPFFVNLFSLRAKVGAFFTPCAGVNLPLFGGFRRDFTF